VILPKLTSLFLKVNQNYLKIGKLCFVIPQNVINEGLIRIIFVPI